MVEALMGIFGVVGVIGVVGVVETAAGLWAALAGKEFVRTGGDSLTSVCSGLDKTGGTVDAVAAELVKATGVIADVVTIGAIAAVMAFAAKAVDAL